MKLSIIIPCFNEKNTILELINRVNSDVNIPKEIILIDDCSTDGTVDLIKNKIEKLVDKVIYHKNNLGKGGCIKSSIPFITGDLVIIQDADLEYSPKDYLILINAFKNNKSEVIYGSRVLGKKRYFLKNFSSIYRIFFNHVLSIITNIVCSQNLTDAHTCYKLFSKKVLDKISLKENDFSFCPEITVKLSSLGIKIYEVPISYSGRDYKDGKKIKLIDGLKAIYVIFKYSFFVK
jgi:glycosyltransferase involved in cell wall biosynthesis